MICDDNLFESAVCIYVYVYADGIMLLHSGVVEHSLFRVDWVSASNIAKLTFLVVV